MSKYVYEHWRPDIGECFYVGKGCRQRAYVMSGRTKSHRKITEGLLEQGLKVEVRIVARVEDDESGFQLEKERILYWKSRGVPLVNQSEGGPARGTGFKRSPEEREKVSKALRGRKDRPETKERKRAAALARPPLDDATRAKISVSVSSLWQDAEYRQRLSDAHKDYQFTEAHRAAMRAGQAKRAPRTEEHKARISESIKRMHAERKRQREQSG